MAKVNEQVPDENSKTEQVLKGVEQAIAREDVVKIYTNGFGVGLSNADVLILFHRFGTNPVAVVNMSYTLAKTLAQKLGAVVSEFEQAIDQTLLTTERIDEAMSAAKKKKAESAKPSDEGTERKDVH